MLVELGQEIPSILEPLIYERDRYLTYQLKYAATTLAEHRARCIKHGHHAVPANSIVAVVGAGHVPGIKDAWDGGINHTDLAAITAIPEERWSHVVFRWTVGGIFVSGVAYTGWRLAARVLGRSS